MLGGAAVGLPNSSAGKQFHHSSSSPLDLEAWRDTFLGNGMINKNVSPKSQLSEFSVASFFAILGEFSES